MTVRLLSESPIFHGMTLEIMDPENELLTTLTSQFTAYLSHTCGEMWMGDPHQARPLPAIEAHPPTGQLKAITPHGEGPITTSLNVVSAVVKDVSESDIPTQTIKIDLKKRMNPSERR